MGAQHILINGDSLLHNWAELAPGHARRSAAAREELMHRLLQFQDATGAALTLVFGEKHPPETDEIPSTPELEIIYSRPGQTADQLIERTARRLAGRGGLLVVTDETTEHEVVCALGAQAQSSFAFIQTLEQTLEDLHRALESYNEAERSKFRSAV